jgi:hypothetical protein
MKIDHKKMAHFKSILAKWQDKLNLKDMNYKIKPYTKEFDDEGLSEVEVEVFDKIFTIELADRFMKLSEKRQENILLHEMIHGLWNYYRLKADKCMSAEAYTFFEEEFMNEITAMIEKVK